MHLGKKPLLIGSAVLAAFAVAGLLLALNRDQPTLEVETARLERGPLNDTVSASGFFVAERSEVISSMTTGFVVKLLVEVGDQVKPGTALAVVDDSAARAQVESDRIGLEMVRRQITASLASARAEYSRTKLVLERAKQAKKGVDDKLFAGKSGIAYEKLSADLEDAQVAFKAAEEQLLSIEGIKDQPVLDSQRDDEVVRASPEWKRARMALDASLKAVASGQVAAKLSGVVTQLAIAVGDRLQPGSPIARVEDLGSLVADVAVDEVDIGKITVGMKAEITADSILGTTLQGTVFSVDPTIKAEGGGRTCSVRIRFNAGEARIFSGASCMARIRAPVKAAANSIPASALLPGSKKNAVYIAVRKKVAGGEKLVAQKRSVKVGLTTVTRAEILEGLETWNVVITSKVQSLSDGQEISTSEGGNDTARENP